jgi:tetratricopeptide (TPR) repeat protein
MTFQLLLRQKLARFALLAAVLLVVCVMAGVALTHFAYAALTDPKLPVSREMLQVAANYFPNSARVQSRLAANLVESDVDGALSHEQIAEQSVRLAARAVRLSPRSYECRMVAALAREAQGDLAGAEADLRAALALAPNHLRVHWRLANLLVRAGKLEQAIPEFRIVNAGTGEYLPETIELVWQASDGDVAALRSAVGEDAPAKLALSRFLVGQARPEAAADLLRGVGARTALDSPVTADVLNDLVKAGQIELAAELWTTIVHPEAQPDRPLIWNGGFETTIRSGLAQFDWNLSQSKYARVSLVTDAARSGRRALELAFLGVDTTRLEEEIRQLIPVRPGARCHLEAYAKAEKLTGPEAPRITVLNFDSKQVLATSGPVAAGSHDWQLLTVDFVTPADGKAVVIAITQNPQFSYVEPTRGTVWFDDFTMQKN